MKEILLNRMEETIVRGIVEETMGKRRRETEWRRPCWIDWKGNIDVEVETQADNVFRYIEVTTAVVLSCIGSFVQSVGVIFANMG